MSKLVQCYVKGHNCLKCLGLFGSCWRGMLQVPIQGIANWVEGWSFMHYRREINYYDKQMITFMLVSCDKIKELLPAFKILHGK